VSTHYRYRELHPFGAPIIGAGYTLASDAKAAARAHARYLATSYASGNIETSAVIVERYWVGNFYREPERIASYSIAAQYRNWVRANAPLWVDADGNEHYK
jgi:hypothetical protein